MSRSYDDYLASPLWRKIKRRILKRDEKRCRRCGGDADRVHHRSYAREVLDGLADECLVSLCEGCHDIIHLDDRGQRRTDEETELILHQRDTRSDSPEPEVDLRIRHAKDPPGWQRMTAVQRQAYNERRFEIRAEKKAARGLTMSELTSDIVFASLAGRKTEPREIICQKCGHTGSVSHCTDDRRFTSFRWIGFTPARTIISDGVQVRCEKCQSNKIVTRLWAERYLKRP
jgi:hypothetical protein